MQSSKNDLWVEKYRPDNIDDYILNTELKEYFKAMIRNKKVQNCLFAGPAGMGKTTLARLLAKNVQAETIFIPCGVDGTLDVLRTKITDFCNAMSFDGRQKIVILDELDSASTGSTNNFQMALRNIIESSSDDTRFLCTCNISAKIMPAILSRCPLIPLKFDQRDLLQRVKFILDSEQIRYTRESLKAFIEESFKFYPDCRRIVNYLQFCCGTGELVVKLSQIADSGKRSFLEELIKRALSEKDVLNVRRFYLTNKDKVSDYVVAGSDLFNAVVDAGLVTEDGILKLTDQIFMLNQVIDKECMFFGMIITLRKYRSK